MLEDSYYLGTHVRTKKLCDWPNYLIFRNLYISNKNIIIFFSQLDG